MLIEKKNGKQGWILFCSSKKFDTNVLITNLNNIPRSILDLYSDDSDEMLDTWIKLVLGDIDTHTHTSETETCQNFCLTVLTNKWHLRTNQVSRQLQRATGTQKNPEGYLQHAYNKGCTRGKQSQVYGGQGRAWGKQAKFMLVMESTEKLNPANKVKSIPDDLKPSCVQANKFKKHFVSIASSIVDKNQLVNPNLTQIDNFENATNLLTKNCVIPHKLLK